MATAESWILPVAKAWGLPGVQLNASPAKANPTGANPVAGHALITLEDAQEKALQITTVFEGGKSMNYQAVSGNFDGQGISFGLIQWNFGQNTLGPILKKMLDADQASFAACFPANADYDTLKKALNDRDQDAEYDWALDFQKKPGWKAVFGKIGSVAAFNKIQREQAAAQYHPKVVTAITEIRGLAADLMAKVELRSYASLFDLCVQQHGIDKITKVGKHHVNVGLEAIKTRVNNEKPSSQLELMKIVVTERGRMASHKWAADCVSRRMGILLGKPFKAQEYNITVERKNAQFSLISQSGEDYVAGL